MIVKLEPYIYTVHIIRTSQFSFPNIRLAELRTKPWRQEVMCIGRAFLVYGTLHGRVTQVCVSQLLAPSLVLLFAGVHSIPRNGVGGRLPARPTTRPRQVILLPAPARSVPHAATGQRTSPTAAARWMNDGSCLRSAWVGR